MMTDSDIWTRLTAMIVEVSDNIHDPKEVRPEQRLFSELGISSLMAVALVLDLEDEFDIMIKEQDFQCIATVNDLKLIIGRRRAEIG